ncbi:MAG: crossover junction endodeoxyribonuclease RusA [Phycisphaerales bacterium]|nr:crossover junction endodeoxyribonuclease RusA [Phycisphaerales bacterium]MDB5357257.1 crossover junction endodeoxyribonuclease RusA [Phycisphaerales bacterium]
MRAFEFIIAGPPLSLQTKNRTRLQAWKRRVKEAARKRWRRRGRVRPVTHEIAIEILYFFDGPPPDVDNIIKPIQDALIGVVYMDDNQVSDAVCRKRDINRAFRVRQMSAVLARGFVAGDDFLYVKVTRTRDLTRID